MSLRELINSVALYPCCHTPHTTVPCSIVEHWSLTSVCWLEHLDMNHPKANSKGDFARIPFNHYHCYCSAPIWQQPLPHSPRTYSPPPVISWPAAIGSEAWSRPHSTPSYTSEKHYLEVGERWVNSLLLQLANSHRHQVHNTWFSFSHRETALDSSGFLKAHTHATKVATRVQLFCLE